MSDDYLRLIPTDPAWQPAPGAAERVAALLATFVPNASGEVEIELYDEITFVDQGSNFERVACPQCRAELSEDWWSDRMSSAYESHFVDLSVTTPCCATATNLSDLAYDWPAGFARFELSVLNPNRGWLTDAELNQLAVALGHPLRQIMAHY